MLTLTTTTISVPQLLDQTSPWVSHFRLACQRSFHIVAKSGRPSGAFRVNLKASKYKYIGFNMKMNRFSQSTTYARDTSPDVESDEHFHYEEDEVWHQEEDEVVWHPDEEEVVQWHPEVEGAVSYDDEMDDDHTDQEDARGRLRVQPCAIGPTLKAHHRCLSVVTPCHLPRHRKAILITGIQSLCCPHIPYPRHCILCHCCHFRQIETYIPWRLTKMRTKTRSKMPLSMLSTIPFTRQPNLCSILRMILTSRTRKKTQMLKIRCRLRLRSIHPFEMHIFAHLRCTPSAV